MRRVCFYGIKCFIIIKFQTCKVEEFFTPGNSKGVFKQSCEDLLVLLFFNIQLTRFYPSLKQILFHNVEVVSKFFAKANCTSKLYSHVLLQCIRKGFLFLKITDKKRSGIYSAIYESFISFTFVQVFIVFQRFKRLNTNNYIQGLSRQN